MIVADKPKILRAWRSLIIAMGLLLLWDVAITWLYFNDSTHFDAIDIQFTLFGTAIALFVGFMVNAAYARWWEARTLWGQVVNSSRSLAREAVTLVGNPLLSNDIVRAQIAFVHVLRTALRGQGMPPEASAYLPPADFARVEAATNRPTAILRTVGDSMAEANRDGQLSDIAHAQMESTIVALTDAQGGLERIRNTPMPMQYRFLPLFFSRVFCIILPFAVVKDLGWITPIGSGLVGLMFLLAVKVGEDLTNPFADSIHDVPMTALCRTIEIDLVQMLGERPRAAVAPVDDVLW